MRGLGGGAGRGVGPWRGLKQVGAYMQWGMQGHAGGTRGGGHAGGLGSGAARNYQGTATQANTVTRAASPHTDTRAYVRLLCAQVAVAASIVLHHFAIWAAYPERQREGYKFVVGRSGS